MLPDLYLCAIWLHIKSMRTSQAIKFFLSRLPGLTLAPSFPPAPGDPRAPAGPTAPGAPRSPGNPLSP